MMVGRQPEAHAKLGIVFEQRIGPGRPTARRILGPGRGGQVAAVNGGTTGGVGDHHAATKQLCNNLQVRRFPAACAGA